MYTCIYIYICTYIYIYREREIHTYNIYIYTHISWDARKQALDTINVRATRTNDMLALKSHS